MIRIRYTLLLAAVALLGLAGCEGNTNRQHFDDVGEMRVFDDEPAYAQTPTTTARPNGRAELRAAIQRSLDVTPNTPATARRTPPPAPTPRQMIGELGIDD